MESHAGCVGTDFLVEHYEFSGPLDSTTPREFLAFHGTIRKITEWQRLLGGRLKRDGLAHFKPIVVGGFYYGLSPIVLPTDREREAINTGKKVPHQPEEVACLVLEFGFTLNDFVSVDPDVADYVSAKKANKEGRGDEAVAFLESACQRNPREHVYLDLLVRLRLERGDTSAVQRAMEYYQDDMDCAVHAGLVLPWIDALVAAGRYAEAEAVTRRVDLLLEDLEVGRRHNTRFSGQSREFAKYKRESFRSSIASAIHISGLGSRSSTGTQLEEFRRLIELLLSWDQSGKARLLAEHAGDAFLAWKMPADALKFFSRALTLSEREGGPRVKQRLEKKLRGLDR